MLRALHDLDIRQAAHRRLLTRAHACPDTLVVDELGLNHGSARVDIAVVNGHIRGLEIKSDADNLTRLPSQVVQYGTVVDRATLIVTEGHAEKAMAEVPHWWGILLASPSGRGVSFTALRRERANPGVDAMSVARLIWRNEAVDALAALGAPSSLLRRPREALYEGLAERLPLSALRELVRTTLKRRKVWRDPVLRT